MSIENHIKYFHEAFRLAKSAFIADEVPVGAIIVHKDKIIARAENRTRRDHNPLRHAEMIAIEKAAATMKNERLSECELFVTLEPCVMCSGAIIQSRIQSVYYLAEDTRFTSLKALLKDLKVNHVPLIMQEHFSEFDASALLKKFFLNKRKNSNA